MRKIKVLAVILAFLIVNVVATVGSAAPMTSVECRELVGKAYQKLDKMKNYHMSIDLTMSTSFQDKKMNIMTTSECDVQAKPLRVKNAMTMTVDVDARVDEQEIVQYLEQKGNELVSYTFANNHWEKQLMPLPRFDQYDDYSQSIKGITLLEETDDSIIVDVIIDGEVWGKNSEHITAFADMRWAKLMAGLFNDLGDITYRMTINKETAAVAKIELDLSDSMIKVGHRFIELRQLPAADKEVIEKVVDNMKVFMSIDFSQFNQLPKIVIPKEAKNTKNTKNDTSRLRVDRQIS